MNKLFEAHVAKCEEEAAGPDRIVHTQGPPLYLATRDQANTFLLKPDITVWRVDLDGTDARIDRIVDAKWKRLDPNASDFGVDEADLYQLLAYAMRYGCTSLELAYPHPVDIESFGQPPVFKLQTACLVGTITIRVRLLPLWSEVAPEADRETGCMRGKLVNP